MFETGILKCQTVHLLRDVNGASEWWRLDYSHFALVQQRTDSWRSLSSLKGTTLYSATKTCGFKSLFKYIALNWKSFLDAEQTINTSSSVNSRPSRPRSQSVGDSSSQLWDVSILILCLPKCTLILLSLPYSYSP